jgi:hypothetical protein
MVECARLEPARAIAHCLGRDPLHALLPLPTPPPQAGIRVLNTARDGSVTGKQIGSSGGSSGLSSIVAFPSSEIGPTAASKLSVGPGFLSFLYNSPLKCAPGARAAGGARGGRGLGPLPRAGRKAH